MKSWRVRAEPRPCPGLRLAVIALHALVAAVPWAAGCPVGVALPLSLLALAGLPAAMAAVPGPDCRFAGIAFGASGWTVRLATGGVLPAVMLPASRVMPQVAFCRLSVQGRHSDWILPRYAFAAGDFRRLKAALRVSTARVAREAC